MMRTFFFFFYCLLIFTSIFAQHTPSKERGNSQYRTYSQLESNNVRTTIHNFGFTGRTSGEFSIYKQTPFEWPKNSGQVYLALTGLFIGAEVIDNNNDTIHIVNVPTYRYSNYDSSWNFEPIPGYYNVHYNNLASSNDPNTWPEFWPDKLNDNLDPGWQGSWDGYLGKNMFFNGQEIYYKMSDDNYDRYLNYRPDSTDLSRGGLGLIVNCRNIEINETPFEDVVFQIYNIKNDGTKHLNKLAAAKWFADFVGGSGDSHDDKANYNLKDKFLWSYDNDGIAWEFGENPVGMIGLAFLKTPLDTSGTQLGLTNTQRDPAGSWDFNSVPDEIIWSRIMTPNRFFNITNQSLGEFDIFGSCGFFSLAPGESTELITAVILGNGIDNGKKLNDLYTNLNNAKIIVNNEFRLDKYSLLLSNPVPSNIYSGDLNINWDFVEQFDSAVTLIYHSDDLGETWTEINRDSTNNNNFIWNTDNSKEGILNLIQIYRFSKSGMEYTILDSPFTINRNGSNVKPQIKITSPLENEVINGIYDINFISGDADGDASKTKLFYKYYDSMEWVPIDSGLTNSPYSLNTASLPNSNNYRIMGEVISLSDTSKIITKPFSIKNERLAYNDSTFSYFTTSVGTGEAIINIIDSTEITNHSYYIKFNDADEKLVYDIFDATLETKLISNAIEIDGNTEGPYFDGMRLTIRNDSLQINDSLSGWNNNDNKLSDIRFELLDTGQETGRIRYADYQIIFGDVGADTSVGGYLSNTYFPPKEANFSIYNLIDDKKIDFLFVEIDGNDGILSSDGARRDRIVFKEDFNGGDSALTYWVYLISEWQPEADDTLTIIQNKPFVAGDKIFFSAGELVVSNINRYDVPDEFSLSQNYPNPFNPTTTIRYTIPEMLKYNAGGNMTRLRVYDILGREVVTLVNRLQKPGNYEIVFNASNFASGVYYYQLIYGEYRQTRKMILMK